MSTVVNSIINDFVINIATINGSGSQSANTILLKTLFRMGIPVGGKNVFPSNIQGMPTWFWVRASKDGYTGRREQADIVIAMNPQTVIEDSKILKPNGAFIYNSDMKFDASALRSDILKIAVPVKQLVDQSTTQMKIKKLLANIIYVGVIADLLALDSTVLDEVIHDQFGGKESVIEVNKKAMHLGYEYSKANYQVATFPYKAEKMNGTHGKMMIDGNAASALGLLYGGASVAAWYPITPSSSVVENFSKYASQVRKTNDGKNNFAVIQAEDELASICMVLGAGFAGARSFTATSGPGLSLMQEAAGYAYYTEIPSVIWNVQRVGPSTGMPTRTAQGDLYAAVFASHGDTKHPILIPADPKECFEFGQTCFDLAERLQTLVIVLSDLDIGMNLWMQDEFQFPTKSFDRGKVLTAEELSKVQNYARYQDVDGDGIGYRTLPGTKHPAAPYVVRGSGHGNRAQYTEKTNEYRDIVDRLVVKWETARTLVPKPVVDNQGSKIGILTYGSADAAMPEARDFMSKQNLKTDYIRVRAIPFSTEIREFIQNHERVYIIDLNRDAQMKGLLHMEMPELHEKMLSITHYDGTPITADYIAKTILNKELK